MSAGVKNPNLGILFVLLWGYMFPKNVIEFSWLQKYLIVEFGNWSVCLSPCLKEYVKP